VRARSWARLDGCRRWNGTQVMIISLRLHVLAVVVCAVGDCYFDAIPAVEVQAYRRYTKIRKRSHNTFGGGDVGRCHFLACNHCK